MPGLPHVVRGQPRLQRHAVDVIDAVVPCAGAGKIAFGVGAGARPACPGGVTAREAQRGAIRPQMRAPGPVGVDGIAEVDRAAPTVAFAERNVEMIGLVAAIGES